MAQSVRNMVFGGGGAAGALAHLAAIRTIMRHKYIDFSKVKRVAGTSVGGMAALMIALGYTLEEIEHFVKNDFKLDKIADGGWKKYWRFATGQGMHKGEFLRETIFSIFDELDLDVNMTFGELLEEFGKELHINITISTKTNGNYKNVPKTFSPDPDSAKDTPIWIIILASAAAFPYFPPVFLIEEAKGKYRLATAEDHRERPNKILKCIDGGFTKNLLLKEFDYEKYVESKEEKNKANKAPTEYANPETFAIAITEKKRSKDPEELEEEPFDFNCLTFFFAILGNHQYELLQDSKNQCRAAEVPRCGIPLEGFTESFKTKKGAEIAAAAEHALKTRFEKKSEEKQTVIQSSSFIEVKREDSDIASSSASLPDVFVSAQPAAPSRRQPPPTSPSPQRKHANSPDSKFIPPSPKPFIAGATLSAFGFAAWAAVGTLLFLASNPIGWTTAATAAGALLLLACVITFSVKASNRSEKNAHLRLHDSRGLQKELFDQNEKLKQYGLGKTTRHYMIKKGILINEDLPEKSLAPDAKRKIKCEVFGKQTQNTLYLNLKNGMLFFKNQNAENRTTRHYQDTKEFENQLLGTTVCPAA